VRRPGGPAELIAQIASGSTSIAQRSTPLASGSAARQLQLLLPGGQEGLQRRTRVALDQHLCALDVGDALDRHRHRRIQRQVLASGQDFASLRRQVQQRLRGLLRAGLGAHQGLEGIGRHQRILALLQLLRGEGRVVVLGQRGEQRMLRIPGLDPELDRRALRRDEIGVAPGTPGRLQQQREQALGRAEITRKQGRHRDSPPPPA